MEVDTSVKDFWYMTFHAGMFKWIFRFLQWICPDHLYEEIEGDLIQKFNRDIRLLGEKRAKRRLTWNVIRFCRPGIVLRNKLSFELNQAYMMQRYFVIAFRQLKKNKIFSLINVFGLAVGLLAFILITQYVSFEKSYDQFYENKQSIYRVGLKRFVNGELQQTSVKTFAMVRSLLKQNFPDVESYTGFYKTPANTGFLFKHNNIMYNEPGGILNTDSSFFKVFRTLLIRGDATTALREKKDLVISESMAKKIFGEQDPIGQTIERIDDYEEGTDFIISGIIKDIPENSHFHATFIQHLEDNDTDIEASLYTYISITDVSNKKNIEERINELLKKIGRDKPFVKGSMVFLQPITDIHLSSHCMDELEANGNETMLIVLGFIGLLVLVMAWINYVNLQTARFLSRAKEVGIRRVIGSTKSDLAFQFLVEYLCVAIVSICLAMAMLYFVYPYFGELTGIPLHNVQWFNTPVWIIVVIIFALGSLLVGVYPSIFLIRLNPSVALKGSTGGVGQNSKIKKALVVIQFSTSLVLIAFVMIVDKQLDFMKLSNKKIDVEHVIALRNPMAYSNQELKSKHNDYQVFENALLQNVALELVSSSSAIPGTEIGFSYVNLIKRKQNDPYDPTPYKTLFVNNNFIRTYGLKLLAGQDFTESSTGSWVEPWQDKNWTNIILNERAIRQLGFSSPEQAIGAVVDFQLFDDFLKYKIIGVIGDYHHEAVKKEIYPTIFASNYSAFQQVYFSVRLNAKSNPQQALQFIEKTWKEIFPGRPFEYFFVGDYYDQQYKSELLTADIFTFFAGIAIFIACLGILGMTMFETNARLKEISIRKVLGATASNLVALLSFSHIQIMLASAGVAFPLIYLAAEEWLATYPVRIDVSMAYFIIPFIVIVLMIVLTTGLQTIKAASTNPINHLKNE